MTPIQVADSTSAMGSDRYTPQTPRSPTRGRIRARGISSTTLRSRAKHREIFACPSSFGGYQKIDTAAFFD